MSSIKRPATSTSMDPEDEEMEVASSRLAYVGVLKPSAAKKPKTKFIIGVDLPKITISNINARPSAAPESNVTSSSTEGVLSPRAAHLEKKSVMARLGPATTSTKEEKSIRVKIGTGGKLSK